MSAHDIPLRRTMIRGDYSCQWKAKALEVIVHKIRIVIT